MTMNKIIDFLLKHYRGMMTSIITIATICIITLITLSVRNLTQSYTFLEINVVPGIATASINGQIYRNGIYRISPGTYTATLSAEGFVSKDVIIEVQKNQTSKIATYLDNEENGMNYIEQSEADLKLLQNVDEPQAINFLKAYNRKISLQDQLPINASYEANGQQLTQTIANGTYDSRCDSTFCLLISSYGPPNLDVIKDSLSNLGYNLDDYIVFYDVR